MVKSHSNTRALIQAGVAKLVAFQRVGCSTPIGYPYTIKTFFKIQFTHLHLE